MNTFAEKIKAGEQAQVSISIKEYVPKNFDEKPDEWQKGFIEAIITLVVKGKLIPDSEKH